MPGRPASDAATGTTSRPAAIRLPPGRPRQATPRQVGGIQFDRGLARVREEPASVPVRLIPCHWSRRRPVLGETDTVRPRARRQARTSRRQMRARPSGVANRESVYSRALPSSRPPGTATAAGRWCEPLIRQPGDVEVAAARGLDVLVEYVSSRLIGKASAGRAAGALRDAARTSTAIAQSARASPGGARAARTREMRRSELVTVPSFSPQVDAREAARRRTGTSRCRRTPPAAPRAPRARDPRGRSPDRAAIARGSCTRSRPSLPAGGERVEEFDRSEPGP